LRLLQVADVAPDHGEIDFTLSGSKLKHPMSQLGHSRRCGDVRRWRKAVIG
jgi:hypothetical protein